MTDLNTYYVLYEKKGVEILDQLPNIHAVAVDTYVVCQYADGSYNLFRSEFHQGRRGKSPWGMADPEDHDIPSYVKAWLLLMDLS